MPFFAHASDKYDFMHCLKFSITKLKNFIVPITLWEQYQPILWELVQPAVKL